MIRISFRVLAASAAALVGSTAVAFPSGAPSSFTGGPASGFNTCALCHADGPGAGGVDLLGRPSRYIPGLAYDLTIRVFDPGKIAAGFEISVETPAGDSAGELILTDTERTKFASGDPRFVTHTFAGYEDSIAEWASQNNGYSFNVRWIAPPDDIGALTYHIAAIASNADRSTIGDNAYSVAIAAPFNACPADINGDGAVNGVDLLILLSAFGGSHPDADLTGDATVGSADIVTLLDTWGICED